MRTEFIWLINKYLMTSSSGPALPYKTVHTRVTSWMFYKISAYSVQQEHLPWFTAHSSLGYIQVIQLAEYTVVFYTYTLHWDDEKVFLGFRKLFPTQKPPRIKHSYQKESSFSMRKIFQE